MIIKNNSIVKINKGGTQIRTGDRGFAIHGLTTWLYRHYLDLLLLYYIIIQSLKKSNLYL